MGRGKGISIASMSFAVDMPPRNSFLAELLHRHTHTQISLVNHGGCNVPP
jgi:hypothetical protein